MQWSLTLFSQHPLTLDFLYDRKATLIVLLVLLITYNVSRFSSVYIANELKYNQFSYILLLFVVRMLVMVTAGNLVHMLVGWDGLGIISFLLVVFYQHPNRQTSALVTGLTNRVGDVLILISLALN